MMSLSPVDFGGLALPVGGSEWVIAEFTIRGIAVGFTVKEGGAGCGNLEEGCCELRVTGGIDENVMLVWALVSEVHIPQVRDCFSGAAVFNNGA